MSNDRHGNGNEISTDWEARVNALLDGELDEADTESLKKKASEDQDLARTIIEAHQLQRGLDGLALERAPASLRRKLRRIPKEQRRLANAPRWAPALALAMVPVLVVGVGLLAPRQPSRADVERARQDLAVAFRYIDKVGQRTGEHIQDIMETGLRHGVKDPISRHMPYTEQFQKEEST